MEIPKGSIILGIDYGQKVLGLSLYRYLEDPYPTPWDRIIHPQDNQLLIRNLKKIIDAECVDLIVLGVPHFTDGKETQMGLLIKQFGQQLQDYIKLPLYFQDETLTTMEAKTRMMSDPNYNFKVDLKKIDSLCATIILEDFIFALKLKQTNQG